MRPAPDPSRMTPAPGRPGETRVDAAPHAGAAPAAGAVCRAAARTPPLPAGRQTRSAQASAARSSLTGSPSWYGRSLASMWSRNSWYRTAYARW